MKKLLLGLGMGFSLISLHSQAMEGSDDEATLDARYDSDVEDVPFAHEDNVPTHANLEQIVQKIKDELNNISQLILDNKINEADKKLQAAWLLQQVSNNPSYMSKYKMLCAKVQGPVHGPITLSLSRIQKQLF